MDSPPIARAQLSRRWRQLSAAFPRLPFLGFRRAKPQLLQLPPDLFVDVRGLPGDVPTDFPRVLSTISRLMEEHKFCWFVTGDLLLAHYMVPKITGNIEVCVPSKLLDQVQEAFSNLTEFCFSFRPGRSYYSRHLSPYPRFKVKGMNQCFFIVPHSHYGLDARAFDDLMYLPHVGFPLLPLPRYIQGLSRVMTSDGAPENNFGAQIEFLIDGMDIDEEWCHKYLDGSAHDFVLSRSTRSAKKSRMGPHPKYDGNLTTYLHDESEREQVIGVVGRVMVDQDTEVLEKMSGRPSIELTAKDRVEATSSSPGPVSVDVPASLHTNTDARRSLPLQIMSDLHLETSFHCPGGDFRPGYEVFDCIPSSPVLALLGDTGLVSQDGLFAFLERQLHKYEKIFFVMGNHECYHNTYQDAKARMLSFVDRMQRNRSSDSFLGEFIFLDQTRYDLTYDITILGCTLWSHIPPVASEVVSRRLNDFKRIHQWSVETHNSAHSMDAEWLERECAKIKLEEPQRRIVIFTHHAPVIQGSSAPAHQNSPMNTAFATDMTGRSCWGRPVSLWAFGHTHFNCDFVHENIRCISNPRGYDGIEAPRSGFLENLVLYL